MSLRIWLNAKGEQALEQPLQGRADILKVDGKDLRVDTENGCKYVNLYANPIDPASILPAVPKEYIKQVTFVDKYYEGFRSEGIYQHAGGRAMVKTVVKVDTPHYGNNVDTTSVERYQEISISAKSIWALPRIYTKIRQGGIQPSEKWSDGGMAGVTLHEHDLSMM